MPQLVRRLRRIVPLAAAIAVLVGCAQTSDPVTPSPTQPAEPFSLSSADFADGGELADELTADAFAGQCRGENLNPELSWRGVPAGTVSFAITMIDGSADDFVHWVHAAIPAGVTSVVHGGAGELAGVAGQSAVGQFGYFGPCPPSPDHAYEFTVHALDVVPELATGFRYADLEEILAKHSVASASITGVRSGPAL